MKLCDTFRDQSAWTWGTLSDAASVGGQLGEETLTDMNLLALRLKHPQEVITRTIPKWREAVEGADWEWWLTGASGKWLGFRLQAKIIELDTSVYKHLHYKGHKSTLHQSDVLIRSAIQNHPRAIPLYCLYTFWNNPTISSSWPCGSYTEDKKSFGCSLTSAFGVRYLRSRKKANDLQSLLPMMKPWHCLVCCGAFGGGDLPQRAWSYWKHQILGDEERILRDAGDFGDERSEDQSTLVGSYREIQPVNTPPDYVLRLLENQEFEVPDPELRYITVFREGLQ